MSEGSNGSPISSVGEPYPAPLVDNVGKSNSANSLSLSLDSSCERKRRIAMPSSSMPGSSACPSSCGETSVPANKVGKSLCGHVTLDYGAAQPHTSSHPCVGTFLVDYEAPGSIGDGLRSRYHECSAIIEDTSGDTKRSVVCKLKCPLGDAFTYRYPPVPTSSKPMATTGRYCLDVSMKELATQGVRCIEHLYRGMYSNIFVAYSTSNHKYMAIKLTNTGDHICKRELRSCTPCYETKHNAEEVQYLKQFKHKNIITMLGQIETKFGKRAILLEFCANGRLTRILEKTKLMAEPVAAKFFRQMFEAVKYIHNEGYAVRNISLRHFLLNDYYQIKLIDLSEVFPLSQTQSHCSVGVAGFQAPELLNVGLSSHLPEMADIWSLGACLYSMVTGVITTIHHSLAKSYISAFTYPNSVRRLISEDLHDLIAGMLSYVPNHRYTLIRIEYSAWLTQAVSGTQISGCYLLRPSQRLRLNKHEQAMREDMEL